MQKIRVLVVDDSAVIRRLLSQTLAADPALEVAGTAANGKIALDKLTQVNPDLVTMDIEMPELDGLAALTELRKSHPRLPVIMFSTLTQKGAVDTINALARGATDYVTKPSNVGSVTAAIAAVQSDLIPKIKAICGSRASASAQLGQSLPALPRTRTLAPRPAELVAIGVSTGGPNALTEVFRQLPADFPLPIVIVQHMPPVFTRYLAERLDAVSRLTVREAGGGERLTAGTTWLAPGGHHLDLVPDAGGLVTRLQQTPPENSCRPAVDVLFRAVAQHAGPAALAVVMTGMGKDGLRGCQAIRQAGGRVLVQDEASSVVWGMPGAVAQAGLADQIVPLSDIPDQLVRLNCRPVAAHPAPATMA